MTIGEPGPAREDVERSWQTLLGDLEARRTAAARMGGDERVAAHAARGLLDVRTRVATLLDENTFTEIGRLGGDGPTATLR